MLEPAFTVVSAEARPFCATPEISLTLALGGLDVEIHTVMLRAQVQIEAPRRSYSSGEADALRDLFGAPSRFGETMRNVLWTQASAQISGGAPSFELALPCGYDFALAATKYLFALHEGEVPLLLYFSGTIFYRGASGLQVAQIPTTSEARFSLPVSIWQRAVELNYPDWAPLALRKDVFERLYRYKLRRELRTWEETVERLLSLEDVS